jgi:hypothetical protein
MINGDNQIYIYIYIYIYMNGQLFNFLKQYDVTIQVQWIEQFIYLSQVSVSVDWAYIGSWIYWTLKYTSHD